MSTTKRFVVGLDSEDNGRGEPFLFALVHRYGKTVARTRERCREALLALVATWKPRGYKVEVWATNLEYDLLNVFDREHVSEVSFRFGRSYLCSASWRGVDFRDTTRHLQASVRELGELVSLPKLEENLFNGERPDPVRDLAHFETRCVRDAAITYRAAVFLHRAYRELGVRARTTLASTALALWRERYWKREVIRPDPNVWAVAQLAYHGGRTQALAVGTFRDVTVIDVASMYPWAMTVAPLPLPWGLVSRVEPGETVAASGLYKVRVRSELTLPRLPVKTKHGTIFPNGSWVGWYVGEELLAFLAAGGELEVLEGFRFLESVRPFDGYVAALFRRKRRARGLKRQLVKTLMNGLYGKYGQQGRRVRCVSIDRFKRLERRPLDAREWNGLVVWEEDAPPPPWGNMVWAAWVTARARVRIAERIAQLGERGARPLYCDTDSVMFTGRGGRFPKVAARAGDFELKGKHTRLLLVGKKEYALETEPGKWLAHAKGVPLLARYRYLTEGRADFERPVRLRESMRSGETVNEWRRREKVRRVDLKARALLDGTLPHPRVREDGEDESSNGSSS